LLRVDPKKHLLFDPNESIDFQGHTGPFIQYTHARIRSVLNKASYSVDAIPYTKPITSSERDLIISLNNYPRVIEASANEYSPAQLANYLYEVAKVYNKFYHEEPILKADNEEAKQFRLELSAATSVIIKKGMRLLGIEVPDKM
ncbi:MAG TPA: arginine--tRNA ligase, partial [Sphingobacteriaceae bacterium]|nr:arginine--tRNA ligase [Sphingobacteriaceae bacterium]